jgi:hemerythrin
MISCPVKNKIARSIRIVPYKKRQRLPIKENRYLFLIKDGEFEIFYDNNFIETQETGGFFGEENILFESQNAMSAVTTRESMICHIPEQEIKDIPIVRLKLLETFNRRKAILE